MTKLTRQNRHIIATFADLFYKQKNVRKAFETFVGDGYIQHSPML